jgi:glycosyl transferase family 25
MKVFLINLERAKDRLISCEKEFKKIGLDYSVVKAVDGEKVPPTKKEISEYFYILKHGKKVNPREVACYSSHLKALKMFLNSSEEYGLICEDDIEFNVNFLNILEECLKTNQKFDILRLAGSEDKKKEKGNPIKLFELERDYYLSLNLTYKPIAACYLINRKAAKSILKNMKVMHLPYDYALDRDWFLGVRSMTISPSLVNLKKEYHIDNSFIKATKNYKLNTFLRVWTVIPYRFYIESRRFIYKVLLLLKIKLFEN